MEIFQLRNVSYQYPNQVRKVLDGFSFHVQEGEFILICGSSGCGKTTLLRLLKQGLVSTGTRSGEIMYMGQPLEHWDERTLIEKIGFVMQNPDNQIVMDEVIQEIVFSLENLGYSSFEIRKRVAELVHFFGVEPLLKQKPSLLSGGQKQMVNLLSVLLLRPKVLLLDEPTSQLDPIATKELLTMLDRLNKEMGLTIIMIEHQLEEVFAYADRLYMMADGKVAYEGRSKQIVQRIYQNKDERFLAYLPSVSRYYMEMEHTPIMEDIPLTVKEAKNWIRSLKSYQTVPHLDIPSNKEDDSVLIHLQNVYFQYDKKSPYILKGYSLQLHKGELVAVVGGNASGKTTALKMCIGSIRPQRGKVRIFNKDAWKWQGKELQGKIAYLPQNPISYFVHETIEKEMTEAVRRNQVENGQEVILKLLQSFQIEHIRNFHPHDCSGGEIQLAALACMLIGKPELVFLDEPTKALDALTKQRLLKIVKDLHQNGVSIMMVTHDIEFAAACATRCLLMFDGEITADGTPDQLFKGNYFYTTAINRVTRSTQVHEVLTLEEAISKCSAPKATY